MLCVYVAVLCVCGLDCCWSFFVMVCVLIVMAVIVMAPVARDGVHPSWVGAVQESEEGAWVTYKEPPWCTSLYSKWLLFSPQLNIHKAPINTNFIVRNIQPDTLRSSEKYNTFSEKYSLEFLWQSQDTNSPLRNYPIQSIKRFSWSEPTLEIGRRLENS